MRLTFLRPMMWTEDLDATIRFYSDILGFECRARNDDWGWASLVRDDVWIMLSRPDEHTYSGTIGFTGSFYFTTDDVDTLWSEVRDKARVCYDIENFEYGMREFAIYDNNGYLLQFGKPIEGND